MRDKSNIEDMIKALKCVASQIPSGDCHADIENFKHLDDVDFKSVVCTDSEKPRDLINGGEGQCCPYYQKTYGCCFEDGELYWLDDVAKLLEAVGVLQKRFVDVSLRLGEYMAIGTPEECREAVTKARSEHGSRL